MSAPPLKRQKTGASSSSVLRVKTDKDKIYDQCIANKPIGAHFSVAELEEFGIAEREALLKICQELMRNQMLVAAQKSGGGTVYKTRSKQDALKILKLKQDSLMVYQYVEGSDSTGIWKRHLVTKTNMHENTITKCLKDLLTAKLVKEVKSAKSSKRIYMLSHLEPSEENTGGSFFSEGEMDVALIHAVSRYIFEWVQDQSWVEDMRVAPVVAPPKKKKKGQVKIEPGATDASPGINGSEGPVADPEEPQPERPTYRTPLGKTGRPLIPHMANHDAYPTVKKVQDMITSTGIIKDKSLNAGDIKKLLSRLEYDGLVEKIRMKDGTIGYRTVRQSFDPRREDNDDWLGPVNARTVDGYGVGNGFTQAPCGRCPVFRNCQPGGIVSPETCVYLDEWLDF